MRDHGGAMIVIGLFMPLSIIDVADGSSCARAIHAAIINVADAGMDATYGAYMLLPI